MTDVLNPDTSSNDSELSSPINPVSLQETVICDSFAELISNPQLLAAIEALGFTQPTPVQSATIPVALTGKDLIAQAKTGSGKTAAFVIPLLAKIYAELGDKIPQNPYALILAPTRELALQIAEVITSLSSIAPVKVIGGSDMKAQIAGLGKDPRIVVGTPGRVMDLMRQKELRLNQCRFFVLDEADEMLSMGFLQDVRFILSRLPDKRQGLFISATITPRVDMIANSFLTKPELITINTPDTEHPDIEHFYIEVKNDIMAKPMALSDIIETWRPRSAIIFCNTKSDTELVEALLRKRGFDARRINSDLSQSKRNKIMSRIRSGDLQFLVATDIAARGIDIEQIDLIVNYAIHEQPESYVHRTGRTGRAGRSGKAISLVGAHDFGYFHHLRKVLNINFQKIELPTDNDVAEARLAHLYEILREGKIAVKDRDTLIAKKLLKELGEIENPPEELSEICAKLVRYVISRRLTENAASLDEEPEETLEASGESERPRKREKGRDRERRGRDRDERAPRGERREADGNRRERSSGRSGDDQNKDRGPRPERRGREAEGDFRLYIGQGLTHGMNEDTFSKLASEMGDVVPSELRNVHIRDHYGFVDVNKEAMDKLIANLNGIEYNGAPLPIRIAAEQQTQRRDRNSSGDNRSRDKRGRDNRNRDRRSRDGNRN